MMLKYGEGGGMKEEWKTSLLLSGAPWDTGPPVSICNWGQCCAAVLCEDRALPSFLPSTLWGQSEPQKPPSMTCSTWYGRQHPWRVALSPAKNCWQATTSCHDTSHNQRKQSSGEKAKGLESWLNCQQQLWLMVMSKKQQTFTFFLTLLYKSGWGEMI